jgi:polyribonucleotide nucleotidyltransferase
MGNLCCGGKKKDDEKVALTPVSIVSTNDVSPHLDKDSHISDSGHQVRHIGGGAITISCEKWEASHVVGTKGSVIKKLQADSGAHINVDFEKGEVKISGSKDAVKKAQAAVSAILDDAAHPDYVGPKGKVLREQASKL